MTSEPRCEIFSAPNRSLWKISKTLVTAISLAVAWSPMVHAQTVILGAGYTSFVDPQASDSPIYSLEYQFAPFKSIGNWEFGAGGTLSADTNGDTHIGIGLLTRYDLQNQWFIEASVMPGAYFNDLQGNWLGGRFQIRSLVALGYELDDRNGLSFAFMHLSNAGTTEFNPGMNSLLLRWHRRY